MATVIIVLQDVGPGKVDMHLTVEPRQPLGPVSLPGDTAAVAVGRQLVQAAQMVAAAHANHKPQED